MYAFLTLLCVLVVLFFVGKSTKPEGFAGYPPLNTDSRAKLPDTIPPVTELPVSGTWKPSDLPGPLPTAPYQQIGKNLPSPYQDPSLIKTTRQRILNTLELLKGFLAFQAQEIEDRSDPTIQLPLNTARSDFQRLEAEANVLQRNPGLAPQLTMVDIAQIEDNLAYLQKEVELIGSNRPFQGPQSDINLEEGFASGTPATKEQLSEFSSRIQQAIVTLTASGTTDPIVQARVGNLTALKNQVDTIIKQVNSGQLALSDIPIQGSDVSDALPKLDKPNSPLLPILTNITKAIANSQAVPMDMMATLNRYIGTFLDNADASFSFDVKYNGTDTYNETSSLTNTGYPSPYDLNQVSSSPSLTSMGGSGRVTDRYAQDPRAEGRTPATGDVRGSYTSTAGMGTFDWKARSKDIIDQIKKRGMDPNDYGVLKENPGADFSWKGYTKMICSRLQTSSLNKMDEMCGCPPGDWKGWNA
jgi:hypothetical protein